MLIEANKPVDIFALSNIPNDPLKSNPTTGIFPISFSFCFSSASVQFDLSLKIYIWSSYLKIQQCKENNSP